MSGVKEGAAVAQEHQQLQASLAMQSQKLQMQQQEDAQAAQQFQQQLAQKSQETQRQADLDQQRLAITGQYQQQQMGIKQQQLQQGQQKLQMASREAADRFSAQQEMTNRTAPVEEGGGGEDPDKVMLELYPRLYKSGAGASGLATEISRKDQANAPVTTEELKDPATGARVPGKVIANINGRKVVVDDQSYLVAQREKAAAASNAQRQKFQAKRDATKALNDFMKANDEFAAALLSGDTSSMGPTSKKQFPAIKAQYDQLKAAAQGAGSDAATEKDPLGLFK